MGRRRKKAGKKKAGKGAAAGKGAPSTNNSTSNTSNNTCGRQGCDKAAVRGFTCPRECGFVSPVAYCPDCGLAEIQAHISVCPVADNAAMTRCATVTCRKRCARLKGCPKCKGLGLTERFFCSATCFRGNYSTHKRFHKVVPVFTALLGSGTHGVTVESHDDGARNVGDSPPIRPVVQTDFNLIGDDDASLTPYLDKHMPHWTAQAGGTLGQREALRLAFNIARVVADGLKTAPVAAHERFCRYCHAVGLLVRVVGWGTTQFCSDLCRGEYGERFGGVPSLPDGGRWRYPMEPDDSAYLGCTCERCWVRQLILRLFNLDYDRADAACSRECYLERTLWEDSGSCTCPNCLQLRKPSGRSYAEDLAWPRLERLEMPSYLPALVMVVAHDRRHSFDQDDSDQRSGFCWTDGTVSSSDSWHDSDEIYCDEWSSSDSSDLPKLVDTSSTAKAASGDAMGASAVAGTSANARKGTNQTTSAGTAAAAAAATETGNGTTEGTAKVDTKKGDAKKGKAKKGSGFNYGAMFSKAASDGAGAAGDPVTSSLAALAAKVMGAGGSSRSVSVTDAAAALDSQLTRLLLDVKKARGADSVSLANTDHAVAAMERFMESSGLASTLGLIGYGLQLFVCPRDGCICEPPTSFSRLLFSSAAEFGTLVGRLPSRDPMTTIICASDVCSADADGEYQCPECVQLDIPTWFCSDACYRANFSTHQAVHERMMHRLELLKGSRPGDDASPPLGFACLLSTCTNPIDAFGCQVCAVETFNPANIMDQPVCLFCSEDCKEVHNSQWHNSDGRPPPSKLMLGAVVPCGNRYCEVGVCTSSRSCVVCADNSSPTFFCDEACFDQGRDWHESHEHETDRTCMCAPEAFNHHDAVAEFDLAMHFVDIPRPWRPTPVLPKSDTSLGALRRYMKPVIAKRPLPEGHEDVFAANTPAAAMRAAANLANASALASNEVGVAVALAVAAVVYVCNGHTAEAIDSVALATQMLIAAGLPVPSFLALITGIARMMRREMKEARAVLTACDRASQAAREAAVAEDTMAATSAQYCDEGLVQAAALANLGQVHIAERRVDQGYACVAAAREIRATCRASRVGRSPPPLDLKDLDLVLAETMVAESYCPEAVALLPDATPLEGNFYTSLYYVKGENYVEAYVSATGAAAAAVEMPDPPCHMANPMAAVVALCESSEQRMNEAEGLHPCARIRSLVRTCRNLKAQANTHGVRSRETAYVLDMAGRRLASRGEIRAAHEMMGQAAVLASKEPGLPAEAPIHPAMAYNLALVVLVNGSVKQALKLIFYAIDAIDFLHANQEGSIERNLHRYWYELRRKLKGLLRFVRTNQ